MMRGARSIVALIGLGVAGCDDPVTVHLRPCDGDCTMDVQLGGVYVDVDANGDASGMLGSGRAELDIRESSTTGQDTNTSNFGIDGLEPGDEIFLRGEVPPFPDDCTCRVIGEVRRLVVGIEWDDPQAALVTARRISVWSSNTPPSSGSYTATVIDGLHSTTAGLNYINDRAPTVTVLSCTETTYDEIRQVGITWLSC